MSKDKERAKRRPSITELRDAIEEIGEVDSDGEGRWCAADVVELSEYFDKELFFSTPNDLELVTQQDDNNCLLFSRDHGYPDSIHHIGAEPV